MAWACMYLDEPLQRGLGLETAAPGALQHQCSVARPPRPLRFAAAVTGYVHELASGHSPGPPTEGNLPWCQDCTGKQQERKK